MRQAEEERTLGHTPETPFDSIEGTQQFVEMMLELVEETQAEVDADLEAAAGNGAGRREEALRLVAHNLKRLSFHVTKSRRILNDLRSLRRLLLEERLQAQSEKARRAGAA